MYIAHCEEIGRSCSTNGMYIGWWDRKETGQKPGKEVVAWGRWRRQEDVSKMCPEEK